MRCHFRFVFSVQLIVKKILRLSKTLVKTLEGNVETIREPEVGTEGTEAIVRDPAVGTERSGENQKHPEVGSEGNGEAMGDPEVCT